MRAAALEELFPEQIPSDIQKAHLGKAMIKGEGLALTKEYFTTGQRR